MKTERETRKRDKERWGIWVHPGTCTHWYTFMMSTMIMIYLWRTLNIQSRTRWVQSNLCWKQTRWVLIGERQSSHQKCSFICDPDIERSTRNRSIWSQTHWGYVQEQSVIGYWSENQFTALMQFNSSLLFSCLELKLFHRHKPTTAQRLSLETPAIVHFRGVILATPPSVVLAKPHSRGVIAGDLLRRPYDSCIEVTGSKSYSNV